MTDPVLDLTHLDKGELICLVHEVLSSGCLTPLVLAGARWRAATLRAARLNERVDDALRAYLAARDLEMQARQSGRPTGKLMATSESKQRSMNRVRTMAREAADAVERRRSELLDLALEGAR